MGRTLDALHGRLRIGRGLEAERVTGWHRKLHIFTVPFYYVEYGLAQLGALQVWRNALATRLTPSAATAPRWPWATRAPCPTSTPPPAHAWPLTQRPSANWRSWWRPIWKGKSMTITLELAPDVESGLMETARTQGKTPEQLAAETLRVHFAPERLQYPTARQLLAMPAAERGRFLAEAAAHAAPLYEADLALPPEQRELTAISASNDDFYDYQEEQWRLQSPPHQKVGNAGVVKLLAFGNEAQAFVEWDGVGLRVENGFGKFLPPRLVQNRLH